MSILDRIVNRFSGIVPSNTLILDPQAQQPSPEDKSEPIQNKINNTTVTDSNAAITGILKAQGFKPSPYDSLSTNLQKLKEISIKIEIGTKFLNAVTKEESVISEERFKSYQENPGKYCYNNGFIIFVDPNSKEVFVSKLNEEQSKLIDKCMLRPGEMFVPINSWDHFQDKDKDREFLLICQDRNSAAYNNEKNQTISTITEQIREVFGRDLSQSCLCELSEAYDQNFIGTLNTNHNFREDLLLKTQSLLQVNESNLNAVNEKSLRSVINTANAIDPENETLANLNENLNSNKLDTKLKTLLKGITAMYKASPREPGLFDLSARSCEPEKIAVLALTGNQTAQNIFAKALLQAKIIEHKTRLDKQEQVSRSIQNLGWNDGKLNAFDPSELITVRVMKHKPISSGQEFSLETPFDATNGEIVRTSTHFSLNHKVSSHMYGDWSDAPFILLTPLTVMIEANGQPENLNTVDTWWNSAPGERLNIPKSKSIYLEKVTNQEELLKREANAIYFKAQNFSDDDVKEIGDMIKQKSGTREANRFLEEAKDINTRDSLCCTELTDLLVNSEIESLGFKVQAGGMWAWNGDSMDATRQAALYAEKYGTDFGAHSQKADSNFNMRLNLGEKVTLEGQQAEISSQLFQALYLREAL